MKIFYCLLVSCGSSEFVQDEIPEIVLLTSVEDEDRDQDGVPDVADLDSGEEPQDEEALEDPVEEETENLEEDLEETPEEPEEAPPIETNVENEAQVQQEQVEDLKYGVAGIEWYLHDKKKVKLGEAPPDWEQPPLELYKEEPWCHVPGFTPNGERKGPPALKRPGTPPPPPPTSLPRRKK